MKENGKHNKDPSTISEGLLKETHNSESQQIEQEPGQLVEFQTNEHIGIFKINNIDYNF